MSIYEVANRMWQHKVVRFGCIGVINTLTDLTLLNIFVFVFGFKLLIANSMSASISIILSYFWNHTVVFRRAHRMSIQQFIKFFTVTGLSILAVQTVIIYAVDYSISFQEVSSITHLPAAPARFLQVNGAKIVAVLAGMTWNFTLYHLVVFRHPKKVLDVDESSIASPEHSSNSSSKKISTFVQSLQHARPSMQATAGSVLRVAGVERKKELGKKLGARSDTHKVAFILIVLLFILLPYHAFLSVWIGSSLGIYRIAELWKEGIIIGILCAVVATSSKNQFLEYWQKNKIILLTVATYLLLTIIIGIRTYTSSLIDERTWAFATIINTRFFLFFLTTHFFFSIHPQAIRWVRILIIPAIPVLIFGLLQEYLLPARFLEHFGYSKFTILPFQYVNNHPNLLRVQSFLRGANPLGAYLVIVLTASLYKLMASRELRTKLFWLLLIAPSMLLLFYTYSRSAWLGLVVSATCLLIFYSGKKTKQYTRWTPYLIISILLLVLVVATNLRSNTTVQNAVFHSNSISLYGETSNGLRLTSAKDGLTELWSHPLGIGLGTVGPASVQNPRHSFLLPENYFLQIALEIGIQGLALFITITTLVMYYLWKRRSNGLALTLLASLTGIILINMLSHAWTDDTLSLIWWGLAGVALGFAPKETMLANKSN